MNNKIEKLEKNQVKVTIELSHDEWAEMNLQAYNKTKGKYSIQGFRKGKVPMKVLVSAYGEGIFYDEAINLAFNKYYYDVLDANLDIYPVGQPEIDIEKIDADGVTFFAIVPVKPEFEIGQYKGIKFEKIEYTVKDEEIDAGVEKMRNDAGRMIDVTDRTAKDGDTANIDFEGFDNGVAFNGGKGDNYDLELGSHSFIPGFEEGVVGMNVNDEKSIMVKFPADYGEATLADKDAEFKVKVNSIKSKELPTVDDEFVKDVSEFDTVEELRADIKAKLEKQNSDRASYETENQIIDKIAETTTIEIPQVMIEAQIDNMVKDFEYRLMYQGMKLDMYLKYINKTMEEFRADFTIEAEKSVKSQLIIDKILVDEKITAEQADIDGKVAELAEKAGKTVEEYKTTMKPQQVEYISRNVIIDKLFGFLKEVNEIA
ncbi:MAG: trigger factor [Clostridia bacterium]